MGDKNWTFNVSDGGQVNVANDNATIYATQNNGVDVIELDNIVKGIKDSLSDLKEEDAEGIRDVVTLVKEELIKPKSEKRKLEKYLKWITSIITDINNVPDLVSNLQKLVAYVTSFIR